jgi:hypothetical protein
VPVWSDICHVLTDILIYCSTQVLVCWRASSSWWKWKYRRCQNSFSQSSWCKSTMFSSVEYEVYIQLLWTVSLHPVPASLFVSCLRCGNVEEKVLLAVYFVFLTKSVISYHLRSWTYTALGEVVCVVCPEECGAKCKFLLRKLGTELVLLFYISAFIKVIVQQNSPFTEILAVFQKKNARHALAPDCEVVPAFFFL